MEVTFIYPNQLFDSNPALSRNRKNYIIRHPNFFSKENDYKLHKQKLLLHFLSTEDYAKKLIDLGYECEIVEHNEYDNFVNRILISDVTRIHLCVLNDHSLEKSLMDKFSLKASIIFVDSPYFLESQKETLEYFNDRKKFQLSHYYKKLRIKHNILIQEDNRPKGGKWSYDVENRKRLPKGSVIPENIRLTYNEKLLDKYKAKIISEFPNNPGSLENFNYPINTSQALEVFSNFLIEKFRRFGDYQDAILDDETFLFHSIISPSMNIGLLTPREVINTTLSFSKDNYIGLNSLEGFIRQILGWREYIRGIYLSNGKFQKSSNYFEISNDLPQSFYSRISLAPVDNSIKKANSYAYLHHIERLMIIGNIMLLLEIDPVKVNRWFMELFIDSYEWVMVPNVFGMSQFSDGGLMASKPYISSSNYILRMSNHTKGEWSVIWDSLYWQFISNHKEKLVTNPRMSLMVNIFDKKTNKAKEDIKSISENFKEYIF